MSYTTRDLQARVNAILFGEPKAKMLVMDGMKGPTTRKQIAAAMEKRNVNREHKLFGVSGLHRIHWHWTASTYAVTDEVRSHYNDVHDVEGNSYDGGARAEHQANYDWRKGVGVSHTLNANTGAIGQAVAAMGNAQGWPVNIGKWPLSWDGIDAMLMRSIDYHHQFDIPITPYSTLSHAEVQPTLGIKQNGKWDYQILPDGTKIIDPVRCGAILRERMIGLMN